MSNEPAPNATAANPEMDPKAVARMHRSVDTFRVSARGFRRIFSHHFGEGNADVEAVAYHLGQVEAMFPTVREAIRLARYPGAGNRNPKRMALGLVENLSVLERQLREANAALCRLARSHRGGPGKPMPSAAAAPAPSKAPSKAPAAPPAAAKRKAAKKSAPAKAKSRKS